MCAIPYNAKERNLLGFLQKLYGNILINFGGSPVVDIDLFIDTSRANNVFLK